ncbi:hypothetical protein PSPO01_05154 [Paraphaeosphaeria sporulosa]
MTLPTMQVAWIPRRHDMEKLPLCIGVTLSTSLCVWRSNGFNLDPLSMATNASAPSCENYRSATSLLAFFYGATVAIKRGLWSSMNPCLKEPGAVQQQAGPAQARPSLPTDNALIVSFVPHWSTTPSFSLSSAVGTTSDRPFLPPPNTETVA